MASLINKFEVGKTYSTASIGDSECIFSFVILRRTAKSIWAEIHGKVERRMVYIYDGIERFKPFGNYSMAAVISANKGEFKSPVNRGVSLLNAEHVF